MGDLLGSCAAPAVCSFGLCTSPACALADQQDELRGCLFYGVQPDNIDSDDGKNLMLILTNAAPTPANVTVEARTAAGDWEPLATAVVPAGPVGGAARIELNRPNPAPGVAVAGAFRVSSDSPLMAVQIVSDDVDHASRSSAGTALLPAHALGTGYLAITYPQEGTADVLATPGGRAGAAAITVVGTVDGTHVQLELTTPSLVDTVDAPITSYAVTLNEGDALQVFSATEGGDLTGSSVVADRPIAVFSGNIFTSYDYPLTGFNGGDMAEEQLPPVVSWGESYVGAWLPPQTGCDSFFGPGYGRWQVVAALDGTDVKVAPAAGVFIDLPSLTFRLDRGQSMTFFAHPDVTLPVVPAADFSVNSGEQHPIMLAQWMDCEPGLSWGVDTRLSPDVVFALPPGFDHTVVVVRAAGTPVSLDAQPLPSSRFGSRTPDGQYEIARLTNDDLGPCVDLQDSCAHVLSGARLGLSWRGMDVVCSYALTVPPSTSCALPGVSCAD
jgi:hypothetical protein